LISPVSSERSRAWLNFNDGSPSGELFIGEGLSPLGFRNDFGPGSRFLSDCHSILGEVINLPEPIEEVPGFGDCSPLEVAESGRDGVLFKASLP
jgi:hypothetical protein